MDYEQKFEAVLKEVKAIASNMELLLQEFKQNVEEWEKDGIEECHGRDVIQPLDLIYTSLCEAARFVILMGSYHVLTEHKDQLDPISYGIALAQINAFEHLFARYMAKQRTQTATATDTPTKSGGSAEGWMDRLMDDFKKGGT